MKQIVKVFFFLFFSLLFSLSNILFLDDNYWIRSISLSEDGLNLSAGGNDFAIRVFNARSGSLEQILRGHEHVVESVSYCRGSDSSHSSWSSFQDTVSSVRKFSSFLLCFFLFNFSNFSIFFFLAILFTCFW